jgi:hypothetical protein
MSTPPNNPSEGEYCRSVEFEVDSLTETLGSPAPRTITDTHQRALLQQARRWRVSADVVALAHGVYNGRPASLLGLQFRFNYQPQTSNRLSSAEINISFQPAEDDGDDFPVVRTFEPTKIHADVTEVSISRDLHTTASAELSWVVAPAKSGERGSPGSYGLWW